MSCSGQWRPVAAMVGVNLAFAIVNVLLKKILDEGTNRMVIVVYRLLISTIFLVPIACYWERKNRPKLTACILCYLFFGALFGITFAQYLFLRGLEYTSATFSCAFLNTVPVNTFILALPFGLEKVDMKSKGGRAKVFGAVICIGGAILLTFYTGIPLTSPPSQATAESMINYANTAMAGKKTHQWVLGSIFFMASCIAWSSWFLIQAKIGKSYPYQYSSTAILTFFGAIQSAIFSLIMAERNISMWTLKGKLEIISVIYAGMIGSGLCYVGMSWSVKQRGPVFTAAFTPLTQIFAAMFDFFILHEQIYLGSVLGSVLVIAGLYFLLWGKSKDSEECVVKQAHLDKEDENIDTESQLPVTSISKAP